jgi:hypothetical protein
MPIKFNDASLIESLCYDVRLADYPRAKNRARINALFNGVKPFENDDENPVNVNFLEGTKLAHDARSQFYGAFIKPGRFFQLSTDTGPRHKRTIWSDIVTKEMNRIIKRSLPYFETFRDTLLSMDNLPFFYVYRSWTVPELKRIIQNEKEAKACGWT